ncbi:hypothetical protein EVA_14467 [gut metagenome]|uniref:Uncharacterized protein n=1 Tax=gut metagenome TaxID=749906 RepID=J9GDH0_9ZZZZ
MAKHKPTYDYTLIYAFSIDDGKHDHMLKVGKATINYFKDWHALEPDGELLRMRQSKNRSGNGYGCY